MPKMKTKKAMAKRFKITGSGKIKRNKKNTSHMFAAKSTSTKRSNRKSGTVSKVDAKRIKQGLQG